MLLQAFHPTKPWQFAYHTVQVACVHVEYLSQYLEGNTPPTQLAEDDATTCTPQVWYLYQC